MPLPELNLEYVDSWRTAPTGIDLLRMLKYGEGTKIYGGDPYRVIYGGQQYKGPLDKHPRILVDKGGYKSDATGPYQIQSTTWDEAKNALGLEDFSPLSQDRAAIYLAARKLRQFDQSFPELTATGMTPLHMENLADVWASLPNREGKSWYNQPVKPYDELLGVYNQRSLDEAKQKEAVDLSENWLTKVSPLLEGLKNINPFKKEEKKPTVIPPLPPIPDNMGNQWDNY